MSVSSFQRQRVRGQDKTVLTAYLDVGDFARFLLYLLSDSDAYLAIINWKRLLPWRTKHERAIVDANTPLARGNADGTAKLLIPNWQQIRTLYLLVFYEDGSILSAMLGGGDVLEVIRGGDGSYAAERVARAKDALKPGTRRGRRRGVLELLVAAALIIVPVHIPYSGTALAIFGALAIAVGIVILILGAYDAAGIIRPRENWVGVGWRSMEWNKADLRNLLIGLLLFALGILIGSR